MTWSRAASGCPDEVRHQARKWVDGTSGIEAAQIAAADMVVDRITKEYPDVVPSVEVKTANGTIKVDGPTERAQFSISASGHHGEDGAGSISVSYTVDAPKAG